MRPLSFALAVFACVMPVLGGCSPQQSASGAAESNPSTTSPESGVRTALEDWREDYLARNLNELMRAYSVYFQSFLGDNRDQTRAKLANAFEKGKNLPSDIELAQTAVNMYAIAGPVTLQMGDNTVPFTLNMRYEDGAWRIHRMDPIVEPKQEDDKKARPQRRGNRPGRNVNR